MVGNRLRYGHRLVVPADGREIHARNGPAGRMGGQGHRRVALRRAPRPQAGQLEALPRPDRHVVSPSESDLAKATRQVQPQIPSAVSTSTASLRFWISSVTHVSIAAPENPQFGQMLRFSSGMNFAAPSTRYLISSAVSIRG